MKDRLLVRAQILSCQACPLWKSCTAPVPFSGPSPCDIAIIGEAPGADEDHQRVPFVGKSGKLLRKTLTEVGFDVERELSFVNVVSCYPGRTPTGSEINACRDNYNAQLRLIRPRWILALGNVAVSQFRRSRIGEVRGQWWREEGDDGDYIWISATYHPSAILRESNLYDTWRGDLEAFRFFTMGVFDPWQGLCSECGVGMVEVWKDQRGYCTVCVPVEKGLTERQVRNRVRKENKSKQDQLF